MSLPLEESYPDNSSMVIKQSTFKKLIVGIFVAAILSAFLGGYLLGMQTSDSKIIVQDSSSYSPPDSTIQAQPTIPQKETITSISVDDDPMKGDTDAPITMIEFSDFQCPFCGRFYTNTLSLIEKNYVQTGKINFVYRDFPLPSIHPNAIPAAIAAECADEQGKFWEYHDMLFDKQNAWAKLDSNLVISTFSQFATEIGLKQQQFDSCLESGKYLEEVQGDLSDGRSYGVTGTPGFFIGNNEIGFTKVSGSQPYENFKAILDGMLVQ